MLHVCPAGQMILSEEKYEYYFPAINHFAVIFLKKIIRCFKTESARDIDRADRRPNQEECIY